MKRERIRVTVTAEHIEQARQVGTDTGSLESTCPISQATGGYTLLRYATIKDAVYKPSRRAMTFIRAFDAGKSVEPATFIFTRITL